MPSIKFQLNPTYGLGDVVWRFPRQPTWRSSWISEWNDFNNSKPPCGPNAIHQVGAQSDLGFRSRCGFRRPSCIAKRNYFSNSDSLSLRCLPSSFGSIQLTVWKEMSFEEFQDGLRGGHLGYRNGTILAILNLYVTVMPPFKFRLNPTYGLGDVLWRISRWPPNWISEWNDFSNSESLCRSDASHQVSAQSDEWFGRRCRLKNFKMAAMAARYRNGTILAILNLHVATMPPNKFQLHPTYGSGDVENVKS